MAQASRRWEHRFWRLCDILVETTGFGAGATLWLRPKAALCHSVLGCTLGAISVPTEVCRRSTAAAVGRAGFGVSGVDGAALGALGFAGVAERVARTLERPGVRFGDRILRIDMDELPDVGLALEQAKGLVADGDAGASGVSMSVVVVYGRKGTLIDHRLIVLPAGADLALVGRDGHGSKLDALDGPPGPDVEPEDLDAVKTGAHEGLQEQVLAKGPADAAAPEGGVALQVFGHTGAVGGGQPDPGGCLFAGDARPSDRAPACAGSAAQL